MQLRTSQIIGKMGTKFLSRDNVYVNIIMLEIKKLHYLKLFAFVCFVISMTLVLSAFGHC